MLKKYIYQYCSLNIEKIRIFINRNINNIALLLDSNGLNDICYSTAFFWADYNYMKYILGHAIVTVWAYIINNMFISREV